MSEREAQAMVVYGAWTRSDGRVPRLLTLYEAREDAEAHEQRWRSEGHRTGDRFWIGEHAVHLVAAVRVHEEER